MKWPYTHITYWQSHHQWYFFSWLPSCFHQSPVVSFQNDDFLLQIFHSKNIKLLIYHSDKIRSRIPPGIVEDSKPNLSLLKQWMIGATCLLSGLRSVFKRNTDKKWSFLNFKSWNVSDSEISQLDKFCWNGLSTASVFCKLWDSSSSCASCGMENLSGCYLNI